MVKRLDRRKRSSTPSVTISLKPPCLSIEEMEHRLEASRMQLLHPEPSDCPGTVCQCDGQDCMGVCEAYCLIHYV